MGVHGLWKLIESSGQMVPLESLAGKVLAVDISIWLHQAVKGMQDAHGAPLAVAHLLILFHRVCKLLFYKIKPVFVFDGGVPALKYQTMAARRQRSTVAKSEAMKVREKLIKNLLKHEAVRQMLSDEAASAALGLNSFTLPGPSVEEDLYKLPPIAADYADSESENELMSSEEDDEKLAEDIHSIDVTSQEFLNLPAEVRHDILTELIETRKQSSWKNLENMPKKSDNFSDFQMNRLLKRHAVQTSLEKAGKEMGGRALSLRELESLLGDQGVLDPKTDLPSKRIAQDNTTHFLLVRKEDEEAQKKFDIMHHLEDVDYSSESDTDVILQKRQIKTEETPKRPANRPAKVRMTEEIADILSLLEDKDTASDVKQKVANLQSKINLTAIKVEKEEPKITEEEIFRNLADETENCTAEDVKPSEVPIVSDLREDVKPPSSDVSNVKKVVKPSSSEVSEVLNLKEDVKLLPSEVPVVSNLKDDVKPSSSGGFEVLNLKENVEFSSSDVLNLKEAVKPPSSGVLNLKEDEELPCPEVSNVKEDVKPPSSEDFAAVETLVPKTVETDTPVEKITIKIEDESTESTQPTAETTVETIEDSSSDSEKELIPITPTEMESIRPPTLEEPKPPTEPSNSKTDSLTIVINPTVSSEKDDLFADVFESANEVAPSQKEDLGEFDFVKDNLTIEELTNMKKTLDEERLDLVKERGKQEKRALNMTDQIYTDAQELLRLFGIPFVVAPMEAEAQCATLNLIGLTEGTITDDSDIWLFGGRVVYKNFFNQQKHVLEYRSENIEKKFKLTREEMIKMALLVGSDYTLGLNGIGPVTALEIIASFQSPNKELLEGLSKFREWFLGSKSSPPRASLRKKIKNTLIPPGFPSRAVVEAYLHPQVDDSREPFSWAKPDLDLIQKYARAKMGWSTEKCNELLKPVFKKFEEKTSQTTIDRHFRIMPNPTHSDMFLSKRVENAIKRLGNNSVESDDSPSEAKPRKRRKRNTNAPTEGGPSKEKKNPKPPKKQEPSEPDKPESSDTLKLKLINERLHRDVKVPQKELAQSLLEKKKKEAIKIFRTYGGKKKKTKVFAKEEAQLSESSSEDD